MSQTMLLIMEQTMGMLAWHLCYFPNCGYPQGFPALVNQLHNCYPFGCCLKYIISPVSCLSDVY